MSKEGKRSVTIEKLNERIRVSKLIAMICAFLILLGVVFVIVISMTMKLNYNQKVEISLVYWAILLVVFAICSRVCEFCQMQISLKEEDFKIDKMKHIQKGKGNLKENLIIKDEKIILDILGKNIAKLVVDEANEDGLVTSIMLKNDTLISPVLISQEKLISILDEDTKRKMVDETLTSISLENPKEDVMKITIKGNNYNYENMKITKQSLLEMFELKE